jgi:hypothetical protein
LVIQEGIHLKDNAGITPGMESFWVESIVKSQLINHWESHEEPEDLRTIRDRLLRNQERSGRLLGIDQQILQYNAQKQPVYSL